MFSKYRKVDIENRSFKTDWEFDYLFILNKDRKPQCLVCLQVLSVLKEYNLKRHYITNHQKKYNDHSCESRKIVIEQLKKKLGQQKTLIDNVGKIQESSLLASYVLTYELMKAKKPLSDGEFVKHCAVKMAEAFHENKCKKEFQSVPLSKQTVTRRTEDISLQLCDSLKSVIDSSPYFSLAIDESTDISDTCQLLIYIKVIREDFTALEELLKVCSLHGTTKGEDIFKAVQGAVEEYGGFEKLSGVCTDGARAMVGNKNGFVGLLKQKVNVPSLQCIVHQEALCAKSINLSETMATVVKITNLIKGGHHSLIHRKFVAFLEEIDSTYGDLLLHAEVRWLSRGKCLLRFFELRNEIFDFLHGNLPHSLDFQNKLKDIAFLQDVAFLTDITQHLNILNLQLQGKDQTIFVMMGFVDGFKKKLNLFQKLLKAENLCHFPCCKQLYEEEKVSFKKYVQFIEDLILEFDDRFQDFEVFRSQMELFNNPMKCKVGCQPEELQLEVCELQCDSSLQTEEATGVNFWKLISKERYPHLRNWALKLSSLFGSTYICETAFSAMKLVKSKSRNRLTDSMLSHILKIATSQLEVDFKSLIKNFDKPHCSH